MSGPMYRFSLEYKLSDEDIDLEVLEDCLVMHSFASAANKKAGAPIWSQLIILSILLYAPNCLDF